MLSIRATQDCVLSSLLFKLDTHDCLFRHGDCGKLRPYLRDADTELRWSKWIFFFQNILSFKRLQSPCDPEWLWWQSSHNCTLLKKAQNPLYLILSRTSPAPSIGESSGVTKGQPQPVLSEIGKQRLLYMLEQFPSSGSENTKPFVMIKLCIICETWCCIDVMSD